MCLHQKLLQEVDTLSESYTQLQQDHQELTQKHQNFVFYSTPLPVVQSLKEEVESLTEKPASRQAKYDKYKRMNKAFGEETLEMRLENNELMEVR